MPRTADVLIIEKDGSIEIECCIKIPEIMEFFIDNHSIIKLPTTQRSHIESEIARTISHLFLRISHNITKWYENQRMPNEP